MSKEKKAPPGWLNYFLRRYDTILTIPHYDYFIVRCIGDIMYASCREFLQPCLMKEIIIINQL